MQMHELIPQTIVILKNAIVLLSFKTLKLLINEDE
jgi:hypothetical protein